MGEDGMIRGLASEQRRRLIASILTHAEGSFYERLSSQQQRDFRQQVMRSVNIYHDFILDIIKVNRGDELRNEEAINLLRQLHGAARRIEGAVAPQEVASG